LVFAELLQRHYYHYPLHLSILREASKCLREVLHRRQDQRYDNSYLRSRGQRVPCKSGPNRSPCCVSPLMFNLRITPYERANITSNTYWDWSLDHAFLWGSSSSRSRSIRRARSQSASALIQVMLITGRERYRQPRDNHPGLRNAAGTVQLVSNTLLKAVRRRRIPREAGERNWLSILLWFQ